MNIRPLYLICLLCAALPAMAAARSTNPPNWGELSGPNKTRFHGECCYNDPIAHGTRHSSGYPAPSTRSRITTASSGTHIECPKLAAVRVIEGIDANHQPYSFQGTPWTPGQAMELSADRTRVAQLNNQTHLECYYGEPRHNGIFPLDRIMTGKKCTSDGHTGFYCH